MFFEGSEKKFEIVVKIGLPSLRSLKSEWQRVVLASGAQVLSVVSNSDCDAYLLSESSLFVFDQRVIMITCGQTALIRAVQTVFTFVRRQDVELFIYERKNEHLPENQSTDFDADVRILNGLMPGKAYCFGDRDGHHIRLYHMLADYHPEPQDTTLEILMHGLDRESAELFFASQGITSSDVGIRSGLTRLFPDFESDGFIFDPFGYSLNAIHKKEYYTVHVTPQVGCSYASFETNRHLQGDVSQLVDKVLDIFKPEFCLLMLFEREDGNCRLGATDVVDHRISHALECGYRVHFASYKMDSHALNR